MTKNYFLIGNPVNHSVSPAIHNALFKKMHIDAHYSLKKTEQAELNKVIQCLRIQGGANITIPYKQRVIQYLDHIDSVAETIGAVNTIVIENKKLIGYNTDWIGILHALKDHDLCGKTAIVLGAGGAARAVIYALQTKKAKVRILNRTVKKAKALALEYGCTFGTLDDIRTTKKTFLINCTSVGLESNKSPVIDHVQNFKIVCDCVYRPLQTQLLRDAKKKGCITINGLHMLVGQAAASFLLWTHKEPDTKLMYKTAEAKL